jgi:hypothetical protein
MKQFRGLKSHHESHIERAHQQGVRDRRRLGVLGSFASKKTISALKTEATAGKSQVQDMLADTQQRRKRKAVVLAAGASIAEARQDYLNAILELPAIADNFPTMLELTKLSVVHQQEQE